jgi:hypothetical protein
MFGNVQDVTDSKERRVVLRKILQNAGFAGFFEGFNPYTVMMNYWTGKQLICPW